MFDLLKHLSLAVVISLCFWGCSTKTDACSNKAVRATMRDFTGLSGCGWVIELQNGSNIEPINLKDFDIPLYDGLPVWVDYKVASNAASICMVGEIVRINCIRER
jgi:hypothetical protein